MTVNTLIFDFDGTLADSFEMIVRICNQLAKEFGYEIATDPEVNYYRNLSSRQIIKQSGVSFLHLPLLIRQLKLKLNEEIHHLKPIAGIPEALAALHNQGMRLGILTSNARENVEEFLHTHSLFQHFDFVYSGATLFGKNRVIRQCLKQQGLQLDQVAYVGDETRDIDAARSLGIRSIAVGWGFNTPEVLVTHYPDALINHPAELLTVKFG